MLLTRDIQWKFPIAQNFGPSLQSRFIYQILQNLKKVIPKSRLVNAKEKEHLRHERSILEKSNFPFLISLEFAFQTNTDLYMVMEYAAGGELLFHLQRAGGFRSEFQKLKSDFCIER